MGKRENDGKREKAELQIWTNSPGRGGDARKGESSKDYDWEAEGGETKGVGGPNSEDKGKSWSSSYSPPWEGKGRNDDWWA